MKYFLDVLDGQWYLVPEEKRHLWFQYTWYVSTGDWPTGPPNWLTAVPGSYSVVFENPVVRGAKELDEQVRNAERLVIPEVEDAQS